MLVDITKSDAMGNVYTLRENLYFSDLTVPAGFRSDGASVPRFFWRAVFPPGEPAALRAAILHDYVYRTHPEGWSRDEVDRLFLAVIATSLLILLFMRLCLGLLNGDTQLFRGLMRSCRLGLLRIGFLLLSIRAIQYSPVLQPAYPVQQKLGKSIALNANDSEDAKRQWDKTKQNNASGQRQRQLNDWNTGGKHKDRCLDRITDSDCSAK